MCFNSRWQLARHVADLDELVLDNLPHFGPVRRFRRQHRRDQVLGRAADLVLGDDVLALFDAFIGLFQRFGFEWGLATRSVYMIQPIENMVFINVIKF